MAVKTKLGTVAHAPEVSTVGEALVSLNGALSTWTDSAACSDGIDQVVRQWFYETTKGWLKAEGSREALADRLPSLERLIRDCLSAEISYQTDLVKDAKAERAGKVNNNMGLGMVSEIIASEPAIKFLKAWLRLYPKGRGVSQRPDGSVEAVARQQPHGFPGRGGEA